MNVSGSDAANFMTGQFVAAQAMAAQYSSQTPPAKRVA